jgi:hypothetical protein
MDLISVDFTMSLLESSPCLTFSVLLTNEGLIWLNQDEWTGEQKLQYTDVPEDIEPEDIRPMGNYAVSITWPDGFSQVTYI